MGQNEKHWILEENYKRFNMLTWKNIKDLDNFVKLVECFLLKLIGCLPLPTRSIHEALVYL